MWRSLAACVFVAVLLTGLVLSQFATVISTTSLSPVDAPASGPIDRVRAFYEGMNQYLASGDQDFLTLLAPGYQDFTSSDVSAGSQSTLLARLDRFRHSADPPHFTIESIEDIGTLVRVQLSSSLPSTVDAAGLNITSGATSTYDYVRLERNAIVTRWSQDDLVRTIEPLLDTRLPIPAGGSVTFALSRVTIDPETELELSGSTPFGLTVDRGRVTMTAGGLSQSLAAGASLWQQAEGSARITNLGAEAASFWFVSVGIFEPAYGGFHPLVSPPKRRGIAFERYVLSTLDAWPGDTTELRLRLSLVTLPPGAVLQARQSGMNEQLAVVTGLLEATVYRGAGRHYHQSGSDQLVDDQATVSTGDGYDAYPNSATDYEVIGNGPAMVLLLTVVAG